MCTLHDWPGPCLDYTPTVGCTTHVVAWPILAPHDAELWIHSLSNPYSWDVQTWLLVVRSLAGNVIWPPVYYPTYLHGLSHAMLLSPPGYSTTVFTWILHWNNPLGQCLPWFIPQSFCQQWCWVHGTCSVEWFLPHMIAISNWKNGLWESFINLKSFNTLWLI